MFIHQTTQKNILSKTTSKCSLLKYVLLRSSGAFGIIAIKYGLSFFSKAPLFFFYFRLTSEDLDGIIEEIDEDGSGTMDFDEFCQMMMS